MQSAAWRVSLWATLAFAIGTMVVFAMLHNYVATDIQRRTDAWLAGEVNVLGDVAARTPKDRLYNRVVGEVAELASREVPNKLHGSATENDSVFFLQINQSGSPTLWVGSGDGHTNLAAIQATKILADVPRDLQVNGFSIPFRVASAQIQGGSHIYLGLSERDERHVLRNLRFRFFCLYVTIVLLGFGIVFFVTRRMLGDVRKITEAAAEIGQADLSSRVPTNERKDEIGHLALTLNHMLDRIESSMHQLHTITNSLAHDLRSPLTAIRGKLEVALSNGLRAEQADPIVAAIDELDRLTEFLNSTLDVAEAKADALRLSRSVVDLDELVRLMIDLYEPSMSDKGLKVELRSTGSVRITADAALLHRVIANLLDNELKHLPAACTISLSLMTEQHFATLVVEDDGPGFAPELEGRVFEQRVKGPASTGRGLGLAFVHAVVKAHGGTTAIANRLEGGARLILTLPAQMPTGIKSDRHLQLA
jgi:signal transduction histidine kinase